MIWIIAGTSDSYKLIDALSKKTDFDLIASAATDYGKELLQQRFQIRAVSRRMNSEEMAAFISENGIKYLLDAGHPFAEELSRNAIAAAAETGVVYLRYERKSLDLSSFPEQGIIRVKNYLEAAAEADQYQRIFLTTGSKTADIFIKNITDFKDRLIFRVLPVEKIIGRLLKMGLRPANIAALQGPFSREFNRIIFKEYGADAVVSKASGSSGGLKTKIEAALDLKIPIIIIERPEIDYPLKFEEIDDLIEYISFN